ncbi:hypothetical protein HS7_15350 [Sulfolobales archaeon HS-7]|nr:hypothetical protein HS7_15350 [Sulfolobales archaeon HS-7]
MPVVVSDHMDEDVDFYVPPGADATDALNDALILSEIYGVAHIVIRGRLYVYASSNPTLTLDQSEHYVFEGDGLGEIVYVNPNGISNPASMISISPIATQEISYASSNASVTGVLQYSTYGWIVAFRNLRLSNLTSQRWLIITSFPNKMHSTMFYFEGVQFFSSIWINETTLVLFYNCYVNNNEILIDSQSREAIVLGTRFENNGGLAISPRGYAVIGCTFVSSNTYLNPGVDGNNGSIIGCVFDYARLITQGANNLRVVASQFQNVTFSGNGGYVELTQGVDYAIVACTFESYQVTISDIYGGRSLFIAFNTFNFGSNVVVQIRDGYYIDSIVITGNVFISQPYHASLIFITGSPAPGSSTVQFTGKFKMLYATFNTFISGGKGPAYGVSVSSSQQVSGRAYITIALSGVYSYIAFNYFESNNGLYDFSNNEAIGFIAVEQLSSNITGISNLMIFFNVNEGNPQYLPSNQKYTSGFNIGVNNTVS